MTISGDVQASVDASGNSYTTAISNDTLTNSDFLTLMLEELKQQDPTAPTDSNSMLQMQMQMSSIETNTATIAAMESLQNSFAQMSLANASNMIGKIVETGEISDAGITKGWQVSAIESIDGELYVTGYEILGFHPDTGQLVFDSTPKTIAYDSITRVNEGFDMSGSAPDTDTDNSTDEEGSTDSENSTEGDSSESAQA